MEQQLIEKEDRLFSLFNMKLEEASDDHSRISMPVTDTMLNGVGIVHGGVLFTLADIAFSAAANYGGKRGTVTLSSHMSYLAPGRKGPLTGQAKRIRSGKHIAVYDVEIHDADNVLLAKGTFEGFHTGMDHTQPATK